jgi:N-acetylneuraminate 9-O-acetyltransferase
MTTATNGDSHRLSSASDAISPALSSQKVFDVAKSLAGLALVAIYAYACDRMGNNFIFTNTPKEFDRHIGMLYLMLLGVFLATVHAGKDCCNSELIPKSLLFRSQTEEWKGWMQVSILFYHYLFPAPQPLSIYIAARVMVASFLFMTGYGQTMKALQQHGRFHLTTAVLTMIRLNLLVCILCLFMNRNYADYYFAPLVSFWSLFIYVLHTTARALHPATRLGIGFLACSLLSFNSARNPSLPSFAKLFFEPLSWLVSSRATPMDTWLFRLQLDCFSPLIGSALALCTCPTSGSIVSRALDKLESLRTTSAVGIIVIGSVLASVAAFHGLIAMLGSWSQRRAMECIATCDDCKPCRSCQNVSKSSAPIECVASRLGQEEYNNHYHSVLCVVCTLTYLMLRNSCSWLRCRASVLAAFVGQRSLELYVLQYHVWLAADARRILVLIPGWPATNAAVLGAAFFLAAHLARGFTAAVLQAVERISSSGRVEAWCHLRWPASALVWGWVS